jgi:hypothetical protein
LKKRVVGITLALLLALAGCVSKLPPSPIQSVCNFAAEGVTDPIAKTRPTEGGPPIFPIRLTDDGEYVSRCELTDALLELRAEGPHLAVVYVHGWKHDARPDDTDLKNFKSLLAQLSAAQGKLEHPRRVLGLYISWNGETISTPGLTNLTFWGRKKAADLIAHSAIVTKIISAVDGIELKRRRADPDLDDVTIYVGHSFGARMLYSAVSQVLIHQVEIAYPDTLQGRSGTNRNPQLPPPARYEPIAGFGDLVLLLNPAFEASFYRSFETLVRPGGKADPGLARERFSPQQQPLMVTLSAENDWATGLAFPIGQVLGLNFAQIRRKTLGNYPSALTHELLDAPPSATPPGSPPTGFWYDDFCAARVCLKRKPEVPETGDPFIVAQASSDVIDGHNGIWSVELQTFIVGLVAEVIQRHEQPTQITSETRATY